jgi:hypothetical protein
MSPRPASLGRWLLAPPRPRMAWPRLLSGGHVLRSVGEVVASLAPALVAAPRPTAKGLAAARLSRRVQRARTRHAARRPPAVHWLSTTVHASSTTARLLSTPARGEGVRSSPAAGSSLPANWPGAAAGRRAACDRRGDPARRMMARAGAASRPAGPRRSREPDPRPQGCIRPYAQSARLQEGLRSAEAERGRGVRARARGPKRATSDKLPELIGRSDPSDAQGSGATSGGTRRAECGDSHLLGENELGIPRAGRDVRGPTCGRGSPGATRRRGSWPAAKRRDGAGAGGRGRARAPWRRPPLGRARGGAAGARAAAVLADPAARVTARGLAREPRRGVRAGAARAGAVVAVRAGDVPARSGAGQSSKGPRNRSPLKWMR